MSRKPKTWTRTSCGSWAEPETMWRTKEGKWIINTFHAAANIVWALPLENSYVGILCLQQKSCSEFKLPFSSWWALQRLLWATIACLNSVTAKFFFCFGSAASALWRRRWAAETAFRACILEFKHHKITGISTQSYKAWNQIDHRQKAQWQKCIIKIQNKR